MVNSTVEDEKKQTILVVEDDKALRDGLVLNFEIQGYRVVTAADGDTGMKQAFDAHPDLIILDVMLPGWSGLEILEELRAKRSHVPVLILSARDQTQDKIEGLGLGADDYLAKPFELPELLARVEAILRRSRGDWHIEESISFGEVVIAPAVRRVIVRGVEVELSTREFDLLLLLAGSPKHPFTRDVILDRVWGWGFDGTARTVDNFIVALRQKIEEDPAKPTHIKTVRRIGYRLDP
jgi:DNA-binding response OmpR family regulator